MYSQPLINIDPNQPKSSIVDDFMYGNNVANSHVTVRLGFIRKVYGILSVQLTFTAIVSFFIMYFDSVSGFIKENNWILFFNFFSTIILIFALMAKKNEYPLNYYLLGAFTLFQSITVGTVTSLYESYLVVEALVLTVAIVSSLTLYTFQTKRDFKTGGALLFTLLTLLIFGGFIQIFFQSEIIDTGLAVLGAFIFSAFIIFDTQLIMKHLNPEEILKILDAMKRN